MVGLCLIAGFLTTWTWTRAHAPPPPPTPPKSEIIRRDARFEFVEPLQDCLVREPPAAPFRGAQERLAHLIAAAVADGTATRIAVRLRDLEGGPALQAGSDEAFLTGTLWAVPALLAWLLDSERRPMLGAEEARGEAPWPNAELLPWNGLGAGGTLASTVDPSVIEAVVRGLRWGDVERVRVETLARALEALYNATLLGRSTSNQVLLRLARLARAGLAEGLPASQAFPHLSALEAAAPREGGGFLAHDCGIVVRPGHA